MTHLFKLMISNFIEINAKQLCLRVRRRVRDETGHGTEPLKKILAILLLRCPLVSLPRNRPPPLSLLLVHPPGAAPLEVGAAVHGPRPCRHVERRAVLAARMVADEAAREVQGAAHHRRKQRARIRRPRSNRGRRCCRGRLLSNIVKRIIIITRSQIVLIHQLLLQKL